MTAALVPAVAAAVLLGLHLAAGAASSTGASRTDAYPLTNGKIAHWAVVLNPVAAHAMPSVGSKVVAKLDLMTGDNTQNIVLVLDGVDLGPSHTWYRVRLPILPNNSTGWVPAGSLGTLYTVHTHLYVNRETQTLTLKRDGRPIFTTRVGVGKPYWPTPAGEFYIRDKLMHMGDAFYGPVAFGTSARSETLTDWPGGGFVGVHGTSLPGIIPGHVSHGCVRLVNSAILKLASLMGVGTPLTIT